MTPSEQSDSATRLGLGYWRFTANTTQGRRVSQLGDDELREVVAVAEAEMQERGLRS